MQNRFGLLVMDVTPIYMIKPRYSHNYALFYQLLAVICSPIVILMLSWEKPLVKPMAPRSIFHHISFRFTFFAIFYFLFHKLKITKILLYRLSIYIRSHFANNHEGIDNHFVTLGASWFVQVFDGLFCCLLLDWYLGSQNWGKCLLYFAASPFPLQRKNQRMLKR